MKLKWKIIGLITLASLVLIGANALAAGTLTLPESLRIIDVEAFYGDASIDRVALPEDVREIRARAFANSGLTEINLPDRIEYIDDTAFDGPGAVTVTANEGTYAWDWAVAHGYIVPSGDYVSLANLMNGDGYGLDADPGYPGYLRLVGGSAEWTISGGSLDIYDGLFLSGIEASGEWSVNSDRAWFRAEKTTANYNDKGEKIILIFAAENDQTTSRTGRLTISCGSAQRTITVTQMPNGAPRLVSPAVVANNGRYEWNSELQKYELLDSDECPEIPYGDIQFTFDVVDGAEEYTMSLNGYDFLPDPGSNSGTVRFSIPKQALHTGENVLTIYAYFVYEGNNQWADIDEEYVEYEYDYHRSYMFRLAETAYSSWSTTYERDNGGTITGVVITGYSGSDTDLFIPDVLGGYPVTGIGNEAFRDLTSVSSVTIPNSVTSISSGAFVYNNLTAINVTIGNVAYSSLDGVLFNKNQTELIAVPGKKKGAYIIPNCVKSIGDGAFYHCTGLTDITIPDSVTNIGDGAFYDCTGLTDITIPDSVTNIGDSAFRWCYGLKGITIPHSVVVIGNAAFSRCYGFTNVTIPNSVKSIGAEAFSVSGLTSVILQEGVENIGKRVFQYTELSSITIPNSVTSINNFTFNYCEKLTRVSLPASVEYIGPYAFMNCFALKEIVAPEGSYAWDWAVAHGYVVPSGDYVSLANLMNGDGYGMDIDPGYAGYLRLVGENAEWTISGGSLVIHEGLYLSGIEASGEWSVNSNSAWLRAEKATHNYSGEEIILIFAAENDQTTSRTGRLTISCGSAQRTITVTQMPNGAPRLVSPAVVANNGRCEYNSELMKYELLDSDKCPEIPCGDIQFTFDVEEGAERCRLVLNEDSVFSPDAVSDPGTVRFSIPKQALHVGENVLIVEAIFVYEGNNQWADIDEEYVEYEYDYHRSYMFRAVETVQSEWNTTYKLDSGGEVAGIVITGYSGSDAELVIPAVLNGYPVTDIADEAFRHCDNLTSVTIPNGITRIGGYAFQNCSNLTSVTILGRQTSMGEYVFGNCGNLTSVTLKSGVRFIGSSMFEGCGGLTSITIPDSVVRISSNAFFGSGLTSITIPNSVTSIGGYAFENCSNLTSVTIPGSVTSIGRYAFSGCSKLTSVAIQDGVKTIAENMFGGCRALTNITIPDSVEIIGDYAFSNCNSLTSVTIPSGVENIGSHVFQECSSLTNITIPSGVNSIGEWAFYLCRNLTNVTIENGVKSIEGSAFQNCLSLTSVTIPDSMESIGDYAFYSTALTSVNIPDSVKSIGKSAFRNTNLTRVTIPGSVTSIGESMFSDCYKLSSAVISNGVVSIGNNAFHYCPVLTAVFLPSSIEFIDDTSFIDCSKLTALFAPEESYAWDWAVAHGYSPIAF